MIFLSHNFKDKPIVEQIAIRLFQIFGQDNVFYDSWSIQPGDGIIDKMNNGLESCRFFFLFASRNSLMSSMVKLEWQNALMKAVKGDLRIIPVKVDSILLPAVLLQTLYLDLFTNGIDVVITQMVDVINGRNTFTQQYKQFSNMSAKVAKTDKGYNVDIEAKFYMEPRSHYIILMQNGQDEVDVGIRNGGMVQGGFHPNIKLDNGLQGNGWLISVGQATIPGFPFELRIKMKKETSINLVAILHETRKDEWQAIPFEIK